MNQIRLCAVIQVCELINQRNCFRNAHYFFRCCSIWGLISSYCCESLLDEISPLALFSRATFNCSLAMRQCQTFPELGWLQSQLMYPWVHAPTHAQVHYMCSLGQPCHSGFCKIIPTFLLHSSSSLRSVYPCHFPIISLWDVLTTSHIVSPASVGSFRLQGQRDFVGMASKVQSTGGGQRKYGLNLKEQHDCSPPKNFPWRVILYMKSSFLRMAWRVETFSWISAWGGAHTAVTMPLPLTVPPLLFPLDWGDGNSTASGHFLYRIFVTKKGKGMFLVGFRRCHSHQLQNQHQNGCCGGAFFEHVNHKSFILALGWLVHGPWEQ